MCQETKALLCLLPRYWYGKGVERDWSRAAQMYQEASKHKIGQVLPRSTLYCAVLPLPARLSRPPLR